MTKKKKNRGHSAEVWYRLKKNKLAVVGMVVIIIVILVAALAPVIAPYSYDKQDLMHTFAKPSAEHLLGTDKFGRDNLSRLIYGARSSLSMGLGATVLSCIFGLTLGAVAGYFGGVVDNIIMRFCDLFSCVPYLLMCVVISAILGPSLMNAIIAMSLAHIPGSARLLRASILSVRDMEYIEAAKAIDSPHAHTILKHVIPNAIAPSIVSITMGIGGCILSGATLSFVGLGAQPPLAEWGCILSEGRSLMRDHMELVLLPGIAIMITVLAFNLFGDGLRDAFDPKMKR